MTRAYMVTHAALCHSLREAALMLYGMYAREVLQVEVRWSVHSAVSFLRAHCKTLRSLISVDRQHDSNQFVPRNRRWPS